MSQYRWVVDRDHPQGHLVAMTPEEEAQYDADQAAWAIEDAEDDAEEAVAVTLRSRAEAAVPNLVTGANSIENGPLFADRTLNERRYLELLGRGEAAVIRLMLRKLDASD